MLIDGRILLNKEIALRHIGFRLVVIVVTDEVFNCIFREEVPHFGVQLSRQSFIRSHD